MEPLSSKRPLEQPLEAGQFYWQARGPGFESPMLHQDPNSELALDDAERQVFGLGTTIFGLWTTIVTTCLGPLATAGITEACLRGTL